MQRLLMITCFAFLATACGSAWHIHDSQTHDVSNDTNASGTIHLFFAEGAQIVRRTCPDNSLVHDRGTCVADERRINAAPFWQELERRFGAELDHWDSRVSDYHVLIRRVDERLFQMVNVTPDPLRQNLLPEIEQLKQSIAGLTVEIAEYREQIARLQDALQAGDDQDLRNQLALNREQLARRTSERDGLERQLRELRREYVEANASILDPTEYTELSSLRKSYVDDLADARRKIESEIEEQVNLARTVRKVNDQFFVHSHLVTDPRPATYEVVSHFHDVFRREYETQNTRAGEWTGVGITFNLRENRQLAELSCKADLNSQLDCQKLVVELVSGAREDFRHDINLHIRDRFNININFLTGHATHSALLPLGRMNINGRLRIRPFCRERDSRWTVRNMECMAIYR